jgi:DNA invertase Pin-like site-specific DNA recombinase
MKLLSTIQKIIKEAEDNYNKACESFAPVEEIDRLEQQYKDSLKLLKMFNSNNTPPSEDI